MEFTVSARAAEIRPVAQREADIAALRAIAQAAVHVELFTIPLYMGTMYSIQGMHQITGKDEDFYQGRRWPGLATTAKPTTPNERAFNIIFSVFVEEMLHLQLAANLAMCLDAKPRFTRLQNEDYSWICYGPDKTIIPHIVDLRDTKDYSDVRVNIDALCHRQVLLFKAIEQPEEQARANFREGCADKYFPKVPFEGWTPAKTEQDLPMFGTIGCMYQCYYDYMNLHYEDDPNKKLWDYVYNPTGQKDLFNVEQPPGHPQREYPGFGTTITAAGSVEAFEQAKAMINAIIDQGEGGTLKTKPPRTQELGDQEVEAKYQASKEALKVDYPSYTDTGESTDSADTAARYHNGGWDHYKRFIDLENSISQVVTWPQWRQEQKRPWKAEDLRTQQYKPEQDKYKLPSPDVVAQAMNNLGGDHTMYDTINKAAVGSIAGITRVLDEYWDPDNQDVLFPYPSMVGSGDRMAICWALFRRAPDLSMGIGQDTNDASTLLHACQGLDFTKPGNGCAAVEVFHSCRGSNGCKAQGGCGFVQKTSGGANCGFALVAAKPDDGPEDGAAQTDDQDLFSAPGDNKCGGLGGCAVPISESQIMPRGGTMQLFDFDHAGNPSELEKMIFNRGETVYDVAYRAYRIVMEHRGNELPEKPPEPNALRLALPPST